MLRQRDVVRRFDCQFDRTRQLLRCKPRHSYLHRSSYLHRLHLGLLGPRGSLLSELVVCRQRCVLSHSVSTDCVKLFCSRASFMKSFMVTLDVYKNRFLICIYFHFHVAISLSISGINIIHFHSHIHNILELYFH